MADRVVLNGTARALSAREARQLPRLIRRIAQGIAKAHGARADVHVQAGYPVVKNHPSANRILARNFRALFPDGTVEEFERVLGGEDFAAYLQHVPGAMFFLGVRNEEIQACHPWHSPRFHVDESALTTGTALLAASIIDYLCTTK